ncbi:MAG: tetratricopeptide repeat protein [Bacteroidia bacterium]|nr:tetratricopeptide repeat protein [Bacteroidia bacterium]
MRKMILILLCSLFWILNTPAQNMPKAPSQKEIDDAMKGMQKISDGLTPEQKQMMEKMGIKLPTMNNKPKMSADQMQKAMDMANRVVPPKDDARIASIPKSPLTNGSLPAYLTATHNSVLAVLKPEVKLKGEEVYQFIKIKGKSAVATGNYAAGFWMIGKIELALYVMGKACLDDPSNTDNRNNYAAMLSMSGAEQLAIPLLNNLNQRFHKNSTILNNLGQAWFGLGDIDKANAYLDSTIRLYPGHSQANRTKSAIEESKGNKDAAIAAMKKSINEANTEDKQDKLSQLGYEFDEKDIKLPFKPKPDPLGLEKFITPGIPKTVEESAVFEKEWRQFKDACELKINQLNALHAQAEVRANEATKKRQEKFMNANKTGEKVQFAPVFAHLATLKFHAISTDADGTYTRKIRNLVQQLTDYGSSKASITKDYREAIAKLNKEEAKQDGEGKANADFCPRFAALNDAYLKSYNTEWEQIHNELITAIRQKFNQETYYKQYIQWPEDFEVTKLVTQILWLSTLHDTYCTFISSPICGPEKEVKKVKGVLPDFDDIHCDYHSELATPVGKISMDCSRLTAELDLDVVKLGIKQDMNKEGFRDQFMGCSVEVGVSHKVGEGEVGPFTAEASINGGVKAEFDRNGLKDITLKASLEAKSGMNVVTDTSVGDVNISTKISLEAKVSLISGKGSVEGGGPLSRMNKIDF